MPVTRPNLLWLVLAWVIINRVSEESNGVVYAWVAPDSLTGAPRGLYSPITKLVAPQQQQMFSVGGDYQLGASGNIRSEMSMSRLDANRFSDKNADDDYGFALMTAYENIHKLTTDSSGNSVELITEMSHEYLTSHFRTLKPYRTQEFARDWSIRDLPTGEEHLASALVKLQTP